MNVLELDLTMLIFILGFVLNLLVTRNCESEYFSLMSAITPHIKRFHAFLILW